MDLSWKQIFQLDRFDGIWLDLGELKVNSPDLNPFTWLVNLLGS